VAHGVTWHLGRLPARFRPSSGEVDRVGAVVLDDGTHLTADVVVEALGSVPNVEWLAGNGLDTTDGVLSDPWMRTLVDGAPRPDVVAVGDVARFPNALYDGVPRRVEHWSIPTDTGRRAGPALVAGLTGAPLDPRPFAPVPSFWSDQYDERLQSFGSPDLADKVKILEGDLDGEVVAGYFRAGRLVGLVGLGLLPRLLALRGEMLAAGSSGPATG
jgi:NADPH-dependent 2,4-dienoyl-CoA reductase/sulfur reductase-like enzyme